MNNETPMMKQYKEIKSQYKDAILLFRVGDFYEAFEEDAITISRELNITLTCRDKKSKTPMAGVPHHSVIYYIKRLINKGYRVAICEQMEDQSVAKGIVKREVVRVITPGTVIEDSLLRSKDSNYLMSILKTKKKVGIAILEVSTGEFLVSEFEVKENHELFNEIERFQPAEILIPKSTDLEYLNPYTIHLKPYTITKYEDYYFSYENSYKTLIDHFKVGSLDGFGLKDNKIAISAAGAALSYIKSIKVSTDHINKITKFDRLDYMLLDVITLRHLEIHKNLQDGGKKGTLVELLDCTQTNMGSRLLRRWIKQPLLNLKKINQRLDAVQEFYKDIELRESLLLMLKEIYDFERINARLVFGKITPKDLIALKDSLEAVSKIQKLLSKVNSEILKEIKNNLEDFKDLINLIDKTIIPDSSATIKNGGYITGGINEELDELRKLKVQGEDWLKEFELKERLRTGIKSLKVKYNQVFGYFIEVTKKNLKLVPKNYLRKQTLSGAERYITKELKDYESKILSADERIRQIEYEIFENVRREIASNNSRIKDAAYNIAKLDVLVNFARLAIENKYTKPTVYGGEVISITEGRHPVVEKTVSSFKENDVFLDCKDNQILIITGANMAGKSTYIRQVALIVLLAQIGSFVPATKAKIGMVDRLFSRIGSYDALARGKSTFMVEMTEVANILNNATKNSLIILDEIGTGTSTLDGISLAYAIIDYIHKEIGCKTLFATHFHKLTELEDTYKKIKNYNFPVSEEENKIFFTHKIAKGKGNKSYGIQVAKLAGIPQTVINMALELQKQNIEESKELLNKLENLDVLNITPIEALNVLYEMKKMLG
ncbi:MAG TPA: DNA mismatch repair protein MutS [Methanosarcinales archaeon]|nr:DNA mismatch repair protein MutS [Methanosarcinales archaeon]